MGNTMNLQVQTRLVGAHAAFVELKGEMDIYSTPQVKEVMLDLLEKGYHHLVVDLRHAEYLDSTALGMLRGMLSRVREQGGDFRLLAPPARIRRLLEITGLNKYFPIDATEQEATANLNTEGMES